MKRAVLVGAVLLVSVFFVMLYMIGYKVHRETGLNEDHVKIFQADKI